MIKYFSVLYAGHVLEGDTIGFKGTPLDERRYSNERLASVFEISKDIAQHMERLGYDILWSAEHHFQREGYECIPNLSTWGVYLAQHTKRLKFGCAFNVLTMWHPIRLAEDFAVADILTNGRMIFGIGRGYHTREVETFGAPMLDDAANRELFEEQFEIVMKAFHEEAFSHSGKHYTLPPEVPYRGYTLKDITLVPRPIRRPVEVWQPIVSGTPPGWCAPRRARRRRSGRPGAPRHIAAGVDYEDVLAKKAWIPATTAEMTDYLKDLERRYPGLEHIILGFPFGASAADFKDQLERFARDVMPAFRGRAVAAH